MYLDIEAQHECSDKISSLLDGPRVCGRLAGLQWEYSGQAHTCILDTISVGKGRHIIGNRVGTRSPRIKASCRYCG